jgi:hypothetical protein
MAPENVRKVLRVLQPLIHGALETAERAIRDAVPGNVADNAAVHMTLADYQDTRKWLDAQAQP